MNPTLEYICKKFNVRLQPDSDHRCNYQSMPLEISLNREGLAKLFAELEFSGIAEVGVEQGEYSEVLARENPNAALFLVDAWKAYRGYRDHVSQAKLDGFYERTAQRIDQFNRPTRRVELIRKYSVEAAHRWEDGLLDAVYIDANHEFSHVVADLAAWVPKVRVGGIVSGHDFFTSGGPYHVPYAVRGFTEAYKVSPWFVLRGDHTASWMWVKQ